MPATVIPTAVCNSSRAQGSRCQETTLLISVSELRAFVSLNCCLLYRTPHPLVFSGSWSCGLQKITCILVGSTPVRFLSPCMELSFRPGGLTAPVCVSHSGTYDLKYVHTKWRSQEKDYPGRLFASLLPGLKPYNSTYKLRDCFSVLPAHMGRAWALYLQRGLKARDMCDSCHNIEGDALADCNNLSYGCASMQCNTSPNAQHVCTCGHSNSHLT